jgi:hypothetical protein
LREAIHNYNQAQLDGAKDRTQYFEKLTIGSGAAIAAIVSFLGASDKRSLHPEWTLRCSLVALVLALFTALYRNWRYQNYVLAVKRRLWSEAGRDEQRCRNDLFLGASLPIFGWDTGKPINMDEWKAKFAKSDAEAESAIARCLKDEQHRFTEIRVAGNVCLGSICIAMAALVVLAFFNF